MGVILTPFLIAALFAYLGDPLVNHLEKWRISRTYAACLIFTMMLLLFVGIGLMVVPLLQTQIEILILKIPDAINWISVTVLPWLSERFDIQVGNIDLVEIKKILVSHWQQAGSVLDKIIQTLTHSTRTVIGVLINLILVPVVAFYLLRDWPLLVIRMRNLIPRKYIESVSEILSQCNEVLGAFFRGQFLVMFILGIFYTVALALMRLDLAVLIGVLIAILSIVPYLGTIIGLISGILATVFQFHDIKHIIFLLSIFVIGHILESMVLTPLLIGDRVGLHPVAVIFAILLAGTLFGFVGVLLAIPVAAVLMVILKYLYKMYINSDFYKK